MTAIKILVVYIMLIRAVYTDIVKGKIENRLMLLGGIAGLLFLILTRDKLVCLEGLRNAAMMFASLFFLYLIKGLGAGDVKLLCVLALFFQKNSFGIVVIAFFAAALLALFKMVRRVLKKQKLYKKGETIHFSIPIAIATTIILFWEVGL